MTTTEKDTSQQHAAPTPEVKSAPPGGALGVLYDLALKAHEQMDRNLVVLDDKIKQVIGATSVILAGQAAILTKVEDWPAYVIGVVSGFVFIGMAIFAWRAFWVADTLPLPDAANIYADLGHKDETAARMRVMGGLDEALKHNKALHRERVKNFRRAAQFMVADIVFLALALLATPFLLDWQKEKQQGAALSETRVTTATTIVTRTLSPSNHDAGSPIGGVRQSILRPQIDAGTISGPSDGGVPHD